MNKLNLKLQGKETGINDAVKNVHQFQTELFLLLRELQSGDYTHFPKTSVIITKHEGVKPSDHIAILEKLFNNFEDRFQDFVCFQPFLDIFENPFKCDISKYEFAIQSELIILRSENVPPHGDNIEFWKNLEESSYPILKRISFQCLSLFPTTYFCEKIFSDLKFICSKQRHSLTSSHLSNILLLRSCHESIHIKDFIRDII